MSICVQNVYKYQKRGIDYIYTMSISRNKKMTDSTCVAGTQKLQRGSIVLLCVKSNDATLFLLCETIQDDL